MINNTDIFIFVFLLLPLLIVVCGVYSVIRNVWVFRNIDVPDLEIIEMNENIEQEEINEQVDVFVLSDED